MKRRTIRVALLAALAAILVMGLSSVVQADRTWSDLPDTVTAKYGLTDNQVAGISEGYTGGLWRPFSNVTRAQFAKMAVAAFNIPLANSAIASYTDVPKGSLYYQYIEGAKAAGVITGTTTTTFSPNVKITRQQAIAIVARFIAKAQGYDLATMYSADDITHLLSHFGDAASISTDLRDEMAFAFDMGITNGDDFGNLKPQGNLTRIQGAALLIRSQQLVPPEKWVPANIVLESVDKSEGLIGQAFTVKYKVTTASGHPAIGVLVDFDTLEADWYVGNDQPTAALTDNNGEVTVKMLSTEPGVQRLSAQVPGLPIQYTTRYWVALDEVYNTNGNTAQNNAGVQHTWGVRVVVFGPGPRSTSVSDWYNAIKVAYVPGDAGYAAGLTYAFDPANVNVIDGIDANNWAFVDDEPAIVDNWSMATETILAQEGYEPRTLAGINVKWSIYDRQDDPLTALMNEAQASVGSIVAVDGVAITPAKTATGTTDADGLSTITISSEATGQTFTQAVADYTGNPYPQELFDHGTFEEAVWWHNFDWDDQPTPNATQTKTWIPHTIGGDAGPISLNYQTANVGEEKTLTLTLTDSFGNPVEGKEVEWFMQGVGFFNTDDLGDISDQDGPNSEDFDTTNAAGQCNVFVKSYLPGEQIVHAKVRDKGTGGAEGTYITYTAEVQWFDVNVVTFDDITTTQTQVVDVPSTVPNVPDTFKYVPVDEAYSTNPVGTSHTFTLWVYGLKLELDPTLTDPAHQTRWIDSDAAATSYDGVLDSRDADYFGGLLLVNLDELTDPNGLDFNIHTHTTQAAFDLDTASNCYILWLDAGGKIIKAKGTPPTVTSQGKTMKLSLVGGYTEFDVNRDGMLEAFSGKTGIYLPLAGKTVTFTKVPSLQDMLTVDSLSALTVASVGSITAPTTTVTTDAAGKATVTVTSNVKGPQTTMGSVTWKGDPYPAVNAYAKKLWVAGSPSSTGDLKFVVKIDGTQVANNDGEIKSTSLPAYTTAGDGVLTGLGGDLNRAHVEVHVQDQYGNDLPDYEVVYLLNSIGKQLDNNTYVPLAYLFDYDPDNIVGTVSYDTNGERPDGNEPMPSSDPYGNIVGPGYTGPGPSGWSHRAFFFNQWLGTTPEGTFYPNSTLGYGEPGLPKWPDRSEGSDIDAYDLTYDDYVSLQTVLGLPWSDWNVDAFAWPAVGAPGQDVFLATDGAKAWTLDGWYYQLAITSASKVDDMALGTLAPNVLTGSNLDVQLAEDVDTNKNNESILRVMIYAPGDGVIQEGNFIYSTQVHILWEVPHVDTIALTPEVSVNAYVVAGTNSHQLTASAFDQFGAPIDATIYFWGTPTEGDGNYGVLPSGGGIQGVPQLLGSATTTDGVASLTWTSATGWSNWNIVALANSDGSAGGDASINSPNAVTSDVATKYWAEGEPMVTSVGGTVLAIPSGLGAALSGRTIQIKRDTALTGVLVGSATYDNANGNTITLSQAITDGTYLWGNFLGDSLTDNCPNWIYGLAVSAPSP